MTQYIANHDHYDLVIGKVVSVRKTLWIGTADIKDMYIKQGRETAPFLKLLSDLIQKGVEVRLIHAKEPGVNFKTDFDKFPALFDGLERALCPRVHFKLIIFDFETVYIGSANLTGAGIGMKGEDTRNFEAGILSTDPTLLANAIKQFDAVWCGTFCQKCKRKAFCGDRIE
ncbi:MAG: phospholipase D-like domain-containing protein [Dysgonamonadaceae bacterium]|jgi:phosphatidylserine/phosphatidylglycerophosphate/cardiolipin synthase-like enzyme|nr:phospholipase D-like domain-containing protein [Dysgonamonadaceae bacterium]